MAVKRIIAFVLMIITSLTLSGCIFPSGPYHYSHDSGFVFDFEEISYTYNDEVVFHIEFPMTTYAIDDHNGDDYYNFLIENDYRIMNDVFQEVLEDYVFIDFNEIESNQTSYKRTTGSTQEDYNYIDIDIDDDKVTTHIGFLINGDGFILQFTYDSFTLDGEKIVVPLTLSKAYYEAHIPISFQSISYGRATINDVTIINRIEVEYDLDYIYVFPGYGQATSVIYNMENFHNRYSSNPNLINEYIPEPGSYNVCNNGETNENCFYTEKSENLFSCYFDVSNVDKIKDIYLEYYEGEVVGDSVFFTFLDNRYEFTFDDDLGYIIYPVFDEK
jgi:hypothetical protein